MKEYDFIISYDISDPKRLRKIARTVEKRAMRLQYSVFVLFDATHEQLQALLQKLLDIYNPEQDDIRVYKIKRKGIHMGSAIDLENPYDFFI